MSKPIYHALFAGGDLAGVGLQAAGYRPGTLVEIDGAIAEVARANHPDADMLVADVCAVDWRRLERPDLLWASVVCTRASRANPARGETALDLALADAVCAALRVLTPPTFCLENVREYRAFASFKRIVACLDELGYQSVIAHINSADMGVPQTRIRLILRACRGALVPHLPAPVPWVGWYSAIEDLVPTLPESRFAPWQLARLDRLTATTIVDQTTAIDRENGGRKILGRESGQPIFTVTASENRTNIRAFLVSGQSVQGGPPSLRDGNLPSMTVGTNADRCRALLLPGTNARSVERGDVTVLRGDDPAMTVTAEIYKGLPRAFIVHPTDQRSMPVRDEGEPVWTITGGSNNTHAPDVRPRAWLDEGRVVKMTPRALGRFQSLPDSYQLPDKAGLATQVIGNGVPCLMAQRIGEAFLRGQ